MANQEVITREAVLNLAHSCVCGQREQDYGSPESSFGVIAEFWSVYMGQNIGPTDVAAMLALLKIARISSGKPHIDNWIDLAGYAACGGEIESREKHHGADTT